MECLYDSHHQHRIPNGTGGAVLRPMYLEVHTMTWPFPTKPIPNDQRIPKYNPANEEDAPL